MDANKLKHLAKCLPGWSITLELDSEENVRCSAIDERDHRVTVRVNGRYVADLGEAWLSLAAVLLTHERLLSADERNAIGDLVYQVGNVSP